MHFNSQFRERSATMFKIQSHENWL
ncbi:hypothetical protein EMIT0111MI5_250018 [Burkholderia sp. IT-111MI5]